MPPIKMPSNAATAAKSLQSCPTLCDPIDGSPPGSSVPGILQARTLEWVAISFSNAWKWKVKVKSLSRVRPSVIPWTAAYQAPPSVGFSRQEYWSGVPLPSPWSSVTFSYWTWRWSHGPPHFSHLVTSKVSGDHVAGTKVKTVLSTQPMWSALTSWISYQTSIEWGRPVGVWGIDWCWYRHHIFVLG